VEKAEATVAVVIFFFVALSALRPNHRDVFVVVVAVWGAVVPRIVVYLSLSLSLFEKSPRALQQWTQLFKRVFVGCVYLLGK
jgi:hypothetical protein